METNKFVVSDIDSFKLEKASLIFRAINHKLRREMVNFLAEGAQNVTSIQFHFKLEQSITSQHLTILRKARIILPDRHGKEIFYHLNHEMIETLDSVTNLLLSK